jgi:hypothetical protein
MLEEVRESIPLGKKERVEKFVMENDINEAYEEFGCSLVRVLGENLKGYGYTFPPGVPININGDHGLYLFLEKEDQTFQYGNNISRTALHYASAVGNIDLVKFLIQKGADVNIKDSVGNTPLILTLMTSPANSSKDYVEELAALGFSTAELSQLQTLKPNTKHLITEPTIISNEPVNREEFAKLLSKKQMEGYGYYYANFDKLRKVHDKKWIGIKDQEVVYYADTEIQLQRVLYQKKTY